MIVDDLRPEPDGKVRFRFSSLRSIPELSGAYIIATEECNILYIGKAGNLRRRFEQHVMSGAKSMVTRSGRAIWFFWRVYVNALALERGWLTLHVAIEGQRPQFNLIDSPIST